MIKSLYQRLMLLNLLIVHCVAMLPAVLLGSHFVAIPIICKPLFYQVDTQTVKTTHKIDVFIYQ